MKLIKINTDHYIIVDDSEIKINDWVYSMDGVHQYFGLILNTEPLPKKIIYSTQPLECDKMWTPVNGKQWMCNTMLCCGKILNPKTKPISLQEVKELIGDVDNIVDELSEKPHYTHSSQQEWFKIGAYSGYNQAIEDNKEKKYTENQAKQIWKAGQEYWKTSGASITFEELTERMIKQPKTEWYVEFDSQGKLKLL